MTDHLVKYNDDETVTISLKLFQSLTHDANFLACLDDSGVDNWEWYSEAWNLYEERYGDGSEEELR